ncbi:MAG: hypothetical protein ORN26_02525, partial [Candidatus Pacebacteria bacterium]|nr:hypothetical protein [Candidatus Paceibacterota bacterium]
MSYYNHMTEGIPKIREIIRKNPITTALLSMLIGGIVTNTYDEGSKQWLVGSRILHLQEKNLLEMTEYSQKIDSIFDKISIIDKDESIKSEDKN